MLNKTFRAALSLLLVFCMLLSVSANGLVAIAAELRSADGNESVDKTINYVSIGDSMTNGYGFEGYEQCDSTNSRYDFINDVGVYGEGSYALQFEAYLKNKGYDVNHTKLAPSALLADDLLYLLGAREEEFDDNWDGYRHYVGNYDDPENMDRLKAHFQTAVTEADIITMCIGNASFGAYLVQQVTEVIGIMGETSQVDPQLTLENGLALLEDEEAKKIVLDIYADMKADINEYIDGVELPINIDALLDLVAYTVASFLVSYEELVDTIVAMNPDVEIILIGLMNTTYGMTITGEGFEFPFGDMMDNAFEALNNYIAGVPAAKQLAGEYEEATFYYAEQPEPDFIVHAFDDLAKEEWNNIDCGDKNCADCTDEDPATECANGRLSGEIVRQRNIDAYNDSLRYAIGSALGFTLPKVYLADIEGYVPVGGASDPYQITKKFKDELDQFDGSNQNELPTLKTYFERSNKDNFTDVGEVFAPEIEKEISIAIYLAIEEAVVANVDTMDITVDGLLGIAGDIFGALGEMPDALSSNPGPVTIKETLVSWFNGSENGRAMCKVYALFKVGNGMSVHPTPTGHDNIAKAVITAYEEKYTAAQKVLDTAIELIAEYYDDAYAYGYQYALENGYIGTTVKAIDDAIAAIKAIDLADAGMTAELQAKIAAEFAAVIETLEAAKALILEADALDQASLDALLAMLNEASESVEALLPVLNQAGVDVNNLVIIPAINAAIEHIETVVIPAAIEAAEIIVKKAKEQIIIALGDAYDYLMNAIVIALPQIDEALYNYLYNNPEEVIAFFANYGPYMVELMLEHGVEVLTVVAYALYAYGPDLAAYVVENPKVILANLSAWADKYGDRTLAMMQVYAEALGLCDAVRDQIAELEAQIVALNKQLETAVGEAKAEIEAQIADVKAAIENLKAEMEAALANGLADLETLKAALADLNNKVEALVDTIKATSIADLLNSVIDIQKVMVTIDATLNELLGDVYADLKAALNELAMFALDAVVDALKKYFPELADEIYNYLYNNPEEVIEFFKTYGPYMAELMEEYGDEVLGVIGYILYYYGEDIAAYLIENQEEILVAMAAWFDVHGENTAKLIQVYAEALGLCDTVRDQIAELEAILEELYAALEKATGEAKEAVLEEIAKVETAIAELKAELETLMEKINAVIIDVNATVEEAIANVKAAIAEIKEAVAELKAEIEMLLEEAKAAIKNQIDAAIEAVVAELEALLKAQLESLEDVVAALEAASIEAVKKLKAIVDQLVYDATHAEYVIDMESYYLAIGSDPEFAKLLAQALDLEKSYGVTDWDNVDLASVLKADLITLSYNENQLSDFASKQALGYVADYVNVEVRNSLVAYVVETMEEVLPKMLPALSAAAINKYVAIVSAQINGTIDQLSAEYFGDATVSEMDWATIVGSNNVSYVDVAREGMREAFLDAGVPETYAYQIPVLDYLYENLDMLGEFGQLLDMFDKEIVYEMFGDRAVYTVEIPVADTLTFAGEAYAFGYAQFNIQYAETVLTINKINPDAIVVLLGHYNAFQGVEFELNGATIQLGDVYGDFAKVTSAHSFVYALLQENTIYVDIFDAETVFGAYAVVADTSVLDFVGAYIADSTITSVSAAGHEYIKEQILNALTVIDTRGLIGDADNDGDVDSTDAMLVLQYDALIIGKDELNLKVCDVDGDGDVDSTDAMYILQYDALLIEMFPVEE